MLRLNKWIYKDNINFFDGLFVWGMDKILAVTHHYECVALLRSMHEFVAPLNLYVMITLMNIEIFKG